MKSLQRVLPLRPTSSSQLIRVRPLTGTFQLAPETLEPCSYAAINQSIADFHDDAAENGGIDDGCCAHVLVELTAQLVLDRGQLFGRKRYGSRDRRKRDAFVLVGHARERISNRTGIERTALLDEQLRQVRSLR